MRFGFFFKIFIVALLWYLWYLTADQIGKIKPLKSFDPFQILGIEPGAEATTIKKAFRKLSLIKHPDKNPNDPIAATEFIQITKAYNALTDDTARANWEKYGNPDGPGSFHVAIALPRFLLQKEYQVQVLGAFFFVLLILIPGYFYVNLDQSSKDIGGVHVDNRKIYAYLINENLILKNCPALLANSIELRGMKVKTQDEAKTLAQIKQNDEIKELVPKLTTKRGQQIDMKALVLILGYLLRSPDINENVKEDLELILGKAPYHIELMIQMAIMLAIEFKLGRSRKRITAKNVLTLLEFSQNIVQALWKDDDPLLQIPYIDDERIKQIRRKKKALTIEEYCKMTTAERKELDIFDNESQFQDAEKAVSSFPLVNLEVKYFVEGEKEIAVGDLLTIQIIVTQLNVGEKQQSGFVHSNQYPFLKQNQWYLIFTDKEESDFLAMEKIPLKERVFIKELKDPMRNPGRITLNILLRNDSYKGFDKQIKVEIDVLKEVQRAMVEYNDEDIQAAKQPSLMQQVMEMKVDDSDDDEEEEDEVKTTPSKGEETKVNQDGGSIPSESKKDQ